MRILNCVVEKEHRARYRVRLEWPENSPPPRILQLPLGLWAVYCGRYASSDERYMYQLVSERPVEVPQDLLTVV